MMIDSGTAFMRKSYWKVQKHKHPEQFTTKNTHGFNSLNNPPRAHELEAFRTDFFNLIKNIEFKKNTNTFQKQLKH